MANHHPPPSLKDWLLLAIGVTFVIMGLAILRSNRDVGIVTLALFGTCTAVFAAQIIRKFRYRRFSASMVEVAGGVPILPRRGFGLFFGAWLLGLGIVFVVFGASYPAPFRWIGGFVGAVGAALLIGTALGWFPGGYLQFDPDALTLAQRRWRARVPWDNVDLVLEADLNGNPVLLIAVDDLEAVVIEPPEAKALAYKAIAKNRMWMGYEFAIMTTHYGIDLPVLAATVNHYARDPSVRATLRQRLPPP